MINVVLFEPEIPQNSGNIARTCAATGSSLHLIHPLGFSLDDKYLKRAGLDYWQDLKIFEWDSFDHFINNCNGIFKFVTTKSPYNYSSANLKFKKDENLYLIFGKESAGIPEEILIKNKEKCIRVPMLAESRSLNLSNTVAILVYEALRQNSFTGLEIKGSLHRLEWD